MRFAISAAVVAVAFSASTANAQDIFHVNGIGVPEAPIVPDSPLDEERVVSVPRVGSQLRFVFPRTVGQIVQWSVEIRTVSGQVVFYDGGPGYDLATYGPAKSLYLSYPSSFSALATASEKLMTHVAWFTYQDGAKRYIADPFRFVD